MNEDSRWGCTWVSLPVFGASGLFFQAWECDDCGALVRNPYRHSEWHHEERGHRP